MKKQISILLVIIFHNLINFIYAQEKELLPIIPQPQQFEYLKGIVTIHNKKFTLNSNRKLSENSKIIFDEITSILFEKYNSSLDDLGEGFPIKLKYISKQDATQLQIKNIDDIGKFMNEGYSLSLNNELIEISAVNNSRLFYGLQSLKQLLNAFSNEKHLPVLRIIDYPHFSFRGMMDDISRGPIPNLKYMKLQVRRLAELKYNYLMYYIEHIISSGICS